MSAELHSREIVRRPLQLQNPVDIIASPNRPNIRLSIRRLSSESLDCFDWLVKDLTEKGVEMSPVNIYCRTINTREKTMLKESLNGCFRKALYVHFEPHVSSVEPGHSCCTYCHSLCKCNSDCCSVPKPNFEIPKQIPSPVKCRNVTLEEQGLVRQLLEEYRDSLIAPGEHLYTNASFCTGFSNVLIYSVLESLCDMT